MSAEPPRFAACAGLGAVLAAVIVVVIVAVIVAVIAVPASAAATEADPNGRPRIEVAVGMGASVDDTGLASSGLTAIPSFFAMGGFGGGMFGLDASVFASSAIGRYRTPNVPVDRLGVDGMLVIRPAADFRAGVQRYGYRVIRALALQAGLGYERVNRVAQGYEEGDRWGIRLGAHLDLPLVPATSAGALSAVAAGAAGGELRLRLAVRRLIGVGTSTLPDGTVVPDSRAELFAALAVVF
jgi:hypothetical protein